MSHKDECPKTLQNNINWNALIMGRKEAMINMILFIIKWISVDLDTNKAIQIR